MNRKRLFLSTLLVVGVGSAVFINMRNREAEPSLRLVQEAEKTPPGFWEGMRHFTVLYDRSVKVAEVMSADISPSGDYSAYESSAARIMLYRREMFLPKDVTVGRVGLIDKYLWDEQNSRLVITFLQDVEDPKYANCPPLVVDLHQDDWKK